MLCADSQSQERGFIPETAVFPDTGAGVVTQEAMLTTADALVLFGAVEAAGAWLRETCCCCCCPEAFTTELAAGDELELVLSPCYIEKRRECSHFFHIKGLIHTHNKSRGSQLVQCVKSFIT